MVKEFYGDSSFQDIASQLTEAVVMTDAEGYVAWSNASFQELCGYKLEEMVGHRPGCFLQGAASDPVAIRRLREARQNRQSCCVDILNYHKEGHTYMARVNVTPLEDKDGVDSGFVAFAKDISEEYSTQRVLLTEQNKLEMAGKAFRLVAHQWRQPLNVISLVNAFTGELIPKNSSDEEQLRENCEVIDKQIRFLADTIEDFKNFLKPVTQKEVFYACDAARQVRAMFKDLYDDSSCELILPEDNTCSVYGYRSEFMQVILNLFSNSLDAMEERHINERKIIFSASQVDELNIIKIRDTAGGILDELLPERLFEFNLTTKGEKGTGIGLYICRSIIEDRMNGKLWARNVEDGAEMVIELPLPPNVA